MDLSELGEFGFLARVREWLAAPTAPAGPGDDAAVLPVPGGGSIAVTKDLLCEGTHFRLDWSGAADVGFKAAVVNISDLAAMGAQPRWLLVGVGCPPSTKEAFLKDLYDGLKEACELYGCEVVGGDTARAEKLLLSVTALGTLDGPPLLRSGARPSDVLAVTGPLGRAAAGVNLLLEQDARGLVPSDAIACMDAHRRPQARVAEGLALRSGGAHAAIDLSDGLASDLRRLAEASGVGAEITTVPVALETQRVAERRGWDAQMLALSGGEDYELLVATGDIEGLIPIGRVLPEGLWLVEDGERRPLPEGGWDHFSNLGT